jgi:hypothetical protein
MSLTENELIEEARQHVLSAATILKNIGPEMGRVGWLLEDVLTYIDEAQVDSRERRLSEVEGSGTASAQNTKSKKQSSQVIQVA